MSEGGNRNCERKSKDFPISSSFFFPFVLPLPSHFLSLYCLPLTLPLHTPCSVLDTHAYLTVPHLQKQWTYSLAFRVLMKAPILVASLLFPHTYSKLISSRLTSPALCYTIGSTLILQLGRLACVFFFCFFFLVPRLVQEFNYRGTDVYGLEPRGVWEMWQNPHGVFYPFILHSIHPGLLY